MRWNSVFCAIIPKSKVNDSSKAKKKKKKKKLNKYFLLFNYYIKINIKQRYLVSFKSFTFSKNETC